MPEALNLALEARRRASTATMTAAELGELLVDASWPADPDVGSPGDQVVAFLAGWISGSRTDSSESDAFNALFIDEMARVQSPPVDLATGLASPDDVRLSLLELQLLAAAFDRHLAEHLGLRPHPGVQLASLTSVSAPCTDVWRQFGADPAKGGLLNQIRDVAIAKVFGKELDAALKAAGWSEKSVGNFGNSLSVLGSLMRVWKLVALYRNSAIHIAASDEALHKPNEEQSDIDVLFTARVGIDEAEWQEYQNRYGELYSERLGLHDCLNQLGLPYEPDVADIAKEVGGWRIRWIPQEGFPDHAVVSPRNVFHDERGRPLPGAGRLEFPVEPTSDHSAEARLLVELDKERKSDHPGEERTVPVTVRANLKTSQMPSVSTFVNVWNVLGLADSLVELVSGLFQELATPKAWATVTVTYHVPAGWSGTISYDWDGSAYGLRREMHAVFEFRAGVGTWQFRYIYQHDGTLVPCGQSSMRTESGPAYLYVEGSPDPDVPAPYPQNGRHVRITPSDIYLQMHFDGDHGPVAPYLCSLAMQFNVATGLGSGRRLVGTATDPYGRGTVMWDLTQE